MGVELFGVPLVEPLLQTGGLCPVLSCEDALAYLGMDQIWPMGRNHEEIWDISHPMFRITRSMVC